jgi:hypothetical protein
LGGVGPLDGLEVGGVSVGGFGDAALRTARAAWRRIGVLVAGTLEGEGGR